MSKTDESNNRTESLKGRYRTFVEIREDDEDSLVIYDMEEPDAWVSSTCWVDIGKE